MSELQEAPRVAPLCWLWIGLTVGLHSVLWVTGFKDRSLREAVELALRSAITLLIGAQMRLLLSAP
jgi:hypothetical protein